MSINPVAFMLSVMFYVCIGIHFKWQKPDSDAYIICLGIEFVLISLIVSWNSK